MEHTEARDLGRLIGLTLRGGVRRVQEVHEGIAAQVLDPLGALAAPVRGAHGLIASSVYRSVGAALEHGARGAGRLAATGASGRSLDEHPRARIGLAILNGMHGDLLTRETPALALTMQLRHRGRALPLDTEALRQSFPGASSRIVVFLHGLTETEGAWCFKSERHHGTREVSYGSLLQRDLGCTPVYLRYNTGLHISENGAQLRSLLSTLAAHWPVPLAEIVLVGHSMGGLVARSAVHQGVGEGDDPDPWTGLVQDLVTLGAPHLGAPLERGVHQLTHLLSRLPATRAITHVLDARSAGIRDLSHGALVEETWSVCAGGRCAERPELTPRGQVRQLVVLATLARDPESRTGALLGDLLVQPASARGEAADEAHVLRLGGLHHFDLLNHPAVYQWLRGWLRENR